MPHSSDRSGEPEFRVEIDQNPFLPIGGTEVHAVVSVTSNSPVLVGSAVRAAEVIIVDTSGSMYGEKINAAKQAARAAIETLRDGVRFAVVAGHREAEMIFPETARLVEVDASTRAAALDAVGKLRADGGTRMGSWLLKAAALFDTVDDGIKHAILLTDGQNNEMSDVFEGVLQRLAGRFVCDCRGV
ncbi:MAG: VWA domain-containing protein, partial [Nocardiopsis sp. BM-2018]